MNNIFNYKKSPLKIKLTIWYIIILFLVLTFFSSILYLYLENQLKEEVQNMLEIEMQNIKSDSYKIIVDNNSSEPLKNVNGHSIKMLFYNNQKKLLNKNFDSNLIKNIIPKFINEKDKFKIINHNEKKWALLTKTHNVDSNTPLKTGYTSLLYSFNREEKMLDKLLIILAVMIPFTLIFASGGGYFLANRALKAIDVISATAEKISQNNLSQRINVSEKRSDELGRLIKTLNNLLNRLEKSFYRQKQFNADVSHELKTPISVIKAQVEEGLDSEENLTSEQKDILLTIKKQIDQMNNLISQMLILAKADEKDFELNKEKFDLNIVINTVIEEMNNLASKKDISISKEVKGKNDFKIEADLSLITQLLINMIDNAIKYSRDNSKIKVILSNLENYYKINIIDNGIGIAEEDLKNIFNRFYRVDKSRSREYGGTGLGLSICSWIVESHDGEISVESFPGEGSNFSIMLPKK